jgi:hypothetical protein
MAQIISFSEVAKARRRAAEEETISTCVEIVEVNLRLALHLFSHGPEEDRPVRARQLRQLGELLEYMTSRRRLAIAD